MSRRVSFSQMRREAPEWIFPWKGHNEPWWPKCVAVLCAAAFFAGILGWVRIRTSTPNPWGLEQAKVIRVLLNTPEGRALALQARENGPFPLRLLTSDWPGLVRLEADQIAALSHESAPYEPRLRPWPASPPDTPRLSRPGAGVLPPLPTPGPLPVPAAAGRTQPVIVPLSGLAREEVPAGLPAYLGTVDPAMLGESVRFLIQVDAAGGVMECLALSAAGTPQATAELANWLRGIRFDRHDARDRVWAAVRVRFLNQTR